MERSGPGGLLAAAFAGASGTFRLELDSGGVWIGSWIVDRSKVDGVNVWMGRGTFVGRGTGGNIDGMQVRFVRLRTPPMPPIVRLGSGRSA